ADRARGGSHRSARCSGEQFKNIEGRLGHTPNPRRGLRPLHPCFDASPARYRPAPLCCLLSAVCCSTRRDAAQKGLNSASQAITGIRNRISRLKTIGTLSARTSCSSSDGLPFLRDFSVSTCTRFSAWPRIG